MLQPLRLDDLDYRALASRARAMIPSLTSDWTDLNDHDPGITLLQAFAWLFDNLNYYIDAVGEEHRLRLLGLLGIRPRRACARCHAAVRAPAGTQLALPRGSRMEAGGIAFELAESLNGRANRLAALYGERGGALLDLTGFAGSDGSFAPVFPEDPAQEAAALFGFEGELEGETRLFLEIGESGRNPFGDDFTLVTLVWEFWDGGMWRGAEVVSDETCGLLRSGFLTLQLLQPTRPLLREGLAAAHYLRCRVGRGCYDAPPLVGAVSLNCVPAAQTDTAVRTLELVCDGGGELIADWAAEEDDAVSVAVEEADGFSEWYPAREAGALCGVELRGGRPVVTFDAARFGRAPGAGARVLVTVARAGAATGLGETDGCSGQRVALDTRGLLEVRLALAARGADGRRRLTLYDRCPDLALAGYDERVFALDAEGAVFGDSLHGVQPRAGQEIEAVTLVRSRFGDGNVLEGQVRAVWDGAEAVSLDNAVGGEEVCTAAELLPELEQKLSAVTRAVTAADIRALTLATPGLRIDSVAVVPMREYCAATGAPFVPDTVLVAVKPGTAGRLPALTEDYRRMILAHLEQCRLLSTRLVVAPARYVGVSVYGRVALAGRGERAKEQVLSAIEELVDTVRSGRFGRRLELGRLYAGLEQLDVVRAVPQLTLEYAGEGCSRSEQGDLLLHPDSLSYLREHEIEFV